MIGKLTGLVDSTAQEWAIIEVSGVGYIVFCSRPTLTRLSESNGVVSLLIETHVREDHIHLYGFADRAEMEWFRRLSTVQGVGTKVALAILSVLPPRELVAAIALQDKVPLTQAAGVGPKLAGRIVAELKDKISGETVGEGARIASGTSGIGEAALGRDAVSALVNLGYRHAEAHTAVAHAARVLGPEAPLESLIKAGLKELAT